MQQKQFINYNDLLRNSLKNIIDSRKSDIKSSKINVNILKFDNVDIVDNFGFDIYTNSKKSYQYYTCYKSDYDIYDQVYKYFKKWKKESKKLYENYMYIIFIDTYRLMLWEAKRNSLSNEKLETYSKLRMISDINDIDTLIEIDPAFFYELMDGCYKFTNLSDFGKKTAIKETMNEMDFLNETYPLIEYDNINYGSYTNTEDYIANYIEMGQRGYQPFIINDSINNYLRFLHNYDKENYTDNITDMAKDYYKIKKYISLNSNQKSDELLNMIEHDSIEQMVDKTYKNSNLQDLLVQNYIRYSLSPEVRIGENTISINEINDFIIKNTDLKVREKLGIEKPKIKTKDE